MSGSKRTKVSFGKDDYYDTARPSGKRTKTDHPTRREPSTDFEIDHEEALEPAKQRRGAVAKDVYASDDEEVGGGAFSSESEASDDDDKKDDDVDMFATDTPKKTKKKLGLDDIEGQELTSKDQESDDDDDTKQNKLSAFNMQQEMEEGSFDTQGNYVRNAKDPEAFHDQWMEGISKKDMAKAKQAQRVRDQAELDKEATRQAGLPQTQADVYQQLVDYLLPGESVRDALAELGKGAAKIPLWKQKLLAKKNKQMPVVDEQQVAERQRKVEAVTALADQLMALGHFTVYEDTFESIVRYLHSKMVVDEDWVPQSSQRK